MRGARAGELGNVGAGDERLAAGAGEHHHPHLVVGRERGQRVRGRLPHLQRHRVVALGIVEGHEADARFLAQQLWDFDPRFFGAAHSFRRVTRCLVDLRRGADCRVRPSNDVGHYGAGLCSALISRLEKPNSLSTASVCSPSFGGAATRCDGVRDSDTGWPTSVSATCPLRSASPTAFTRPCIEMPDLRIGEHLVDRIDRPARHAGIIEMLDPVGAVAALQMSSRSRR